MFDHFNLLAPIYDRVIQSPDIEIFKQILNLPSSGLLLDAGGGTGRVSSQLLPFVAGVVLSDSSAGMLKQASRKPGLLPVQTTAETLPFASGSFDRILVVDALHHFRDQKRAMSDLIRVLAPSGRLLIQEPNLSRWQVKMIALFEKLALMRSHFYYPEEIGRMGQSMGANCQVIIEDGFAAWIIADK
jgi:demethylmenaquinone methyltransferase/2-methoxy-6-polyprenyl-1,4-benzoquinol methylase